MEIRNWTPANIFEARDKIVETKNMGKVMVKLYVAGWSVGPYERMDIWNACNCLNTAEAVLRTGRD